MSGPRAGRVLPITIGDDDLGILKMAVGRELEDNEELLGKIREFGDDFPDVDERIAYHQHVSDMLRSINQQISDHIYNKAEDVLGPNGYGGPFEGASPYGKA